MDKIQRLERAYQILDRYEVLPRISVVFGQYRPMSEKEFIGHVIANEDWIKTIHVFLDMDNTLFRFSYGKYDEAAVLEKIYDKGFYATLEPMKNTAIYEVLPLIGAKVYILSACVPSEHCKPEKLASIERCMPFISKKNIFFPMIGESKIEYVRKHAHLDTFENAFLIDDYKGNLKEWSLSGGVAIKKAMSYKLRPYPTLLDHRDAVDMILSLASKKPNNTNMKEEKP